MEDKKIITIVSFLSVILVFLAIFLLVNSFSGLTGFAVIQEENKDDSINFFYLISGAVLLVVVFMFVKNIKKIKKEIGVKLSQEEIDKIVKKHKK